MSTLRQGREQLYARFGGSVIGKESYKVLIDSTFNIKDDGLDKNEADGLKLTLTGTSKRLMSFYEKMKDTPSWCISLNPGNQQGLHITEGQEETNTRLFLKTGGNIGVGTVDPKYKLDVYGLVAMEGRVGSFRKGYVSADGSWHTIIQKVEGCQGFEVLAHINDGDDQRFALTHAIVLISQGLKGTKTQVKQAQAGSTWLWGRFFNKISFRWSLNEEASKGDKRFYDLQIKTRTHYGMINGQPKRVFYRVSKIWDKEYESEYYQSGSQRVEDTTTNTHTRTVVSNVQTEDPQKGSGIRILKKD